MAIILNIDNFNPITIQQKTRLSGDLVVGATSITLENASGFTKDYYAIIGEPGTETAEIRLIGTITGNAFATSALTFAHAKNEPVYQAYGNQTQIFKATNVDGTVPADTAFTLLTTLTIQADVMTFDYVESAGSSSYWYKIKPYNSTLSTGLDLSLIQAIRGGLNNYCTIEQARREAGMFNNEHITDEMIRDRRLEADSEINGALSVAGYTLPLASTPAVIQNISRLLTAGYILWQDYGDLDDGTNKEAKAKLDRAMAMLERIKNEELVLLDNYGQTLLSKTSSVSFWPDDTTKDSTDTGGGDFAFKRLDKF